MLTRIFQSSLYLLAALLILLQSASAEPTHAIAMHGEPALPPDYSHFPYVNPDAPKGGRVTYAVKGSFDSVNPFIVQGDASRGLFDSAYGYNVFESLLARNRDEGFTLYPLIAKSIKTDEERTFIEFTLDENARFSNGEPITPQDVVFSMELLREKARPLYRRWIKLAERIEISGENSVRFLLSPEADRETPLLLGLLPILPEQDTDFDNFDRSTLEPMIGSGPYVFEEIKPGELIRLKRNPDYWAKDHPSKRGFDNYDEIRISYFRDENSMFEAFKKGLVDIHIEGDPGRWTGGYDFPSMTDGKIEKDTFKSGLPSGMYGMVFNTRRDKFKDRAVRAALAQMFDFEWANRNLFHSAYTRTKSYFDGSELSASGNPMTDRERELLGDSTGTIDPAIADGTWKPAVSDGSGRDRKFLRTGFQMLRDAGYTIQDGKMTGPNGNPLTIEILLNASGGEQLAIAFQRTLQNVGIDVTLRSVDSAQYQQRLQTYDYDMMLQFYYSSLSPGAEQIGRWGSASRDLEGTYNFAGVADPAVDKAIDNLLRVRTKEDFVAAVRAYDRVLLNGAYVIPLYHRDEQWVAHWKRIEHPEDVPIYGYQLQTWWAAE